MTDNGASKDKLERVIRKIKHCLALSGSSNEHEAALAMKQAKALMRQHRVTEQMVAYSDIGEVRSAHGRVRRRPAWDLQLSAVVAEVFTCRALRETAWCPLRGAWVESAVFVGASPAQYIALYAYETLLRKLTSERRQYASDIRSGKRRGKFSPETCANHFALSWVGEVSKKLAELLPKGEEDLALGHTGTQLVATAEKHDLALIEQYLLSSDVRSGRATRSPKQLDMDALLAGILAGSAVEVHQALSTDGSDQLLLQGKAPEDSDARL